MDDPQAQLWEIRSNLGRHARPEGDGSGFLWEVSRDDQAAQVMIEISEAAWATDPLRLPEATRRALETDGRTELLKVLGHDDPRASSDATRPGVRRQTRGPDPGIARTRARAPRDNMQSHVIALHQDQERHALSNDGRASHPQSSYILTLSSRTRQSAAQPHGSGVRSPDPRHRHGARERRPSEGGGLRKCRRRLLSESLRLPRELRGSDQHPARSDRPRGMARRPSAPDARPVRLDRADPRASDGKRQ